MAEADDNDGWQEAGHGGGGRGATVVQWQRLHDKVMEDGGGRRMGVFIIFLFLAFLGRVEYYLESYLANHNTRPIISREISYDFAYYFRL